jgi:hypothetical protein
LENSLPISCDGEPAPDREMPDIFGEGISPGGRPDDVRNDPPTVGSPRVVFKVEVEPLVGLDVAVCSFGLEVDIIDYPI